MYQATIVWKKYNKSFVLLITIKILHLNVILLKKFSFAYKFVNPCYSDAPCHFVAVSKSVSCHFVAVPK